MKIKVFQRGFNYSQDGTGNRLVYHLQGCNMHCPWCANPEGMAVKGTLVVSPDLLMDAFCPVGAIEGKQLDRSKCELCVTKACITQHRNQGIRLSYEEYDIETIIDEVERSAALFYEGGGVTLSGGEPTLQFDAIHMLLEKLKSLDIHTAIETNASHPGLETLFPVIDMLIMDFKHYDNAAYASVTGTGNGVIKENIAKALAGHENVLIRIPVIKGFNESEGDIRNFAAFFKQYKTDHVSFEFLQYHEYGKTKWSQCGMAYMMNGAFVEQETLALFETIFKENHLAVVHT